MTTSILDITKLLIIIEYSENNPFGIPLLCHDSLCHHQFTNDTFFSVTNNDINLFFKNENSNLFKHFILQITKNNIDFVKNFVLILSNISNFVNSKNTIECVNFITNVVTINIFFIESLLQHKTNHNFDTIPYYLLVSFINILTNIPHKLIEHYFKNCSYSKQMITSILITLPSQYYHIFF